MCTFQKASASSASTQTAIPGLEGSDGLATTILGAAKSTTSTFTACTANCGIGMVRASCASAWAATLECHSLFSEAFSLLAGFNTGSAAGSWRSPSALKIALILRVSAAMTADVWTCRLHSESTTSYRFYSVPQLTTMMSVWVLVFDTHGKA